MEQLRHMSQQSQQHILGTKNIFGNIGFL